jgi:Chaperone of endosialidase
MAATGPLGRLSALLMAGRANTAVGAWALAINSSGNRNVAVGQGALGDNTGSGNVAVGFGALANNIFSGNSSQAFGFVALFSQRDGVFNDGFGRNALYSNVSGDRNTALGHGAGFNITGNGNVDIGDGVGGVAGENNTTRIRNIGNTPLMGQMVVVDSTGKLGYVVSSRRYKEEIKPMDKDSEALFALKPVTFRYKGDIDPAHVKMFGLIAEEVAEVNPDLVVRNAKGEVDTIRFDSINAMLLNELPKENRKVQEMEVIVAQQKKDFEATIAQREKQIKFLAASLRDQARQIQQVSAQLEASKPAPQVVDNP